MASINEIKKELYKKKPEASRITQLGLITDKDVRHVYRTVLNGQPLYFEIPSYEHGGIKDVVPAQLLIRWLVHYE